MTNDERSPDAQESTADRTESAAMWPEPAGSVLEALCRMAEVWW